MPNAKTAFFKAISSVSPINYSQQLPSAPMETNLTPLLAMKSRALLTFAILWNRIFPRSGLGKCSPEITWSIKRRILIV